MFDTIRKIIWLLSGKEKKKMAWLMLSDIVISTIDIVFLAFLLFVINFYAQPATTTYPHFFPGWMLDRNSKALIVVFVFLFLVKSGAGYMILKARFRFVYQVASRMSEANLLRYLEGDFTDYVNVDSAVHTRRISDQPIEFCHYILMGLMQAVTEAVLIVLAVAGIIWFDARLFVLLLIILLPAVFTLSHITKRRLRSVRTNVKTSSEKTLQSLQEALSGFVESNIYERNSIFTRRYAGYQQHLNHYLAELQITQGIPSRLIEVFAVLGLLILICFQATAFVTLGAFMAAAYKIIPGIVKISNISGQMKTYAFALQGLVDQAQSMATLPCPGQPEPIRSIRFDHVYFFRDRKMVLKDLSLCLQPGDFLGISGLSGKGKTTVINLLLGFLSPDRGGILVNGFLADEALRKRNWKRIAYVKQQPFLLHDTVLHNITLGEEGHDLPKMRAAWRISRLHFPEGPEKMVTEQGRNISGGQRQRIAIARALYKDADLILLDEPFNELDRASELLLLEEFRELSRAGKMVLLITHHQESFSFCNKMISLHE